MNCHVLYIDSSQMTYPTDACELFNLRAIVRSKFPTSTVHLHNSQNYNVLISLSFGVAKC